LQATLPLVPVPRPSLKSCCNVQGLRETVHSSELSLLPASEQDRQEGTLAEAGDAEQSGEAAWVPSRGHV
jgi:hypothetical protein